MVYENNDPKTGNALTSEEKAILDSFTLKTVRELFTEDKNYVFSPVSLYIALSMLTEGAKENSFTELLNYLEAENSLVFESITKSINYTNHYKNTGGEAKIANSLWIKDDFIVKDEYLKKLEESYLAEVYHTQFTSESNQVIIDWINYYTNNFLKLTKENYQLSDELVLLIVNTLYFNNKWASKFDSDLTFDNKFHSYTGDVDVKYMVHEVNTSYCDYSDEEYGYIYAEDYFENGNTISYYLPNEGVSVKDLLNTNIFDNKNTSKLQEHKNIIFNVPKFKYQMSFDLIKSLNNLGVNDVFNPYKANLTGIAQDLFVSMIKQDVGIELSEKGVEAAAVTSIGVCTSIDPSLTITLRLDRPFIYCIRDNSGAPLFIGIYSGK